MAARSVVTSHYTDRSRVLVMEGSTGEAFFSVARDPGRPLIVEVGELRVLALGTAFNIRRAGERVVVTVTEGAVSVYSRSAGGDDDGRASAVQVSAGKEVAWNLQAGEGRAAQPAPAVSPAQTSRTLAWQQGRLEYLNEPMAAVIADVNRYSRRPVVLGDAAAGAILFSGTVFTNETEEWIRALPRVFPVRLEARPDGGLVVESLEP
jgi:transmembrane sensor